MIGRGEVLVILAEVRTVFAFDVHGLVALVYGAATVAIGAA